MRLLLISNSGRPYFAHCAEVMREFVGPDATMGFVTAASLGDEREYLSLVGGRLVEDAIAKDVIHIDWRGEWQRVLDSVDAILVGGGNTYTLMERLAASGLGGAIAERVRAGLPYLGSSAGANVAGPNLLTTNDWNVGGSTAFDAFGFVGWNLNTHYVSGVSEAPTGETREDRIDEYLIVRKNPVVGIEEGTEIEVAESVARVRGTGRARLFQKGQPDRWLEPGDTFDVGFATRDRDMRGPAAASTPPSSS